MQEKINYVAASFRDVPIDAIFLTEDGARFVKTDKLKARSLDNNSKRTAFKSTEKVRREWTSPLATLRDVREEVEGHEERMLTALADAKTAFCKNLNTVGVRAVGWTIQWYASGLVEVEEHAYLATCAANAVRRAWTAEEALKELEWLKGYTERRLIGFHIPQSTSLFSNGVECWQHEAERDFYERHLERLIYKAREAAEDERSAPGLNEPDVFSRLLARIEPQDLEAMPAEWQELIAPYRQTASEVQS